MDTDDDLFANSRDDKTHINIVVIGHVDSGKSTTTGKNLPPPTSYLAGI